MITFLRDERVLLSPADDEDPTGPWLLLPSERNTERIDLIARDGAVVGLARLEELDWSARSARLSLRWGGSAEGAQRIIALMRDYATRELNLKSVEARVLADTASVLEGAGFARTGRDAKASAGMLSFHFVRP